MVHSIPRLPISWLSYYQYVGVDICIFPNKNLPYGRQKGEGAIGTLGLDDNVLREYAF